MLTFVFAAMGLQLAVLVLLWLLGHTHVLGGRGSESRPADMPKAALIVPMTGNAPGMRECLRSLLDQDYGNFEAWFVTADDKDPAAELARELCAQYPRARWIESGYATRSSQKNHAILAALGRVSADVAVFAFCDSSHKADRRFLGNLIAPIARGEADLAGGFHKVVPLDGAVGTIGMLVTCLALHLMQPIRLITQPWGGAMAISRKAFLEHDIETLWSTNIVDDFSLGPYLHTQKPKVVTYPVASACLSTPIRGRSVAAWDAWLTRQLLYLKFCIPPGWIGATLAVFVLSAPPILAACLLGGWALGLASGCAALGAGAYLAGFLGLGLVFRRLSPRPVPVLAWLRGYYVTFCMLAWCFGRTFFTNTMRWRGIAYKVAWGGKVREVIRD